MSQNSKNVRVANSISTHSGAGRKIQSMVERSIFLHYMFEKESQSMSAELKSSAVAVIESACKGTMTVPTFTSSETLQNWGSTSSDKPYLGVAVAANIPVTCVGIPVNDRTKPIINRLGWKDTGVRFTRAFAFGLTFGTLFMKRRTDTAKDGKRFTSSVTFCFVSNGLLDLLCGPLNQSTYERATDLWPKEWLKLPRGNSDNRSNYQTNQSRSTPRSKDKRGKARVTKVAQPSVSKALLRIQTALQSAHDRNQKAGSGKLIEVWTKVTVTMLNAALADLGLPRQGKKAELVERLETFCVNDKIPLY